MPPLSRKVVIVTRGTRLDQLVKRFNTKSQARFYIEHLGGDFGDYEREHDCFKRALGQVSDAAGKLARVHHIDWLQAAHYQFAPDDLVATVGQDGLIVNTLKYLENQAIIGFNPEAGRWDGILAQFDCPGAEIHLGKAIGGYLRERLVTKAAVTLSDRQELLAVNDFFLGVHDHSSARYRLRFGNREEAQSSSGLIVSTPLGRSGWLQSVINGSSGIVSGIGGKKLKVNREKDGSWDEDVLYFAVREPFKSVSSGADLVYGRITPDAPLVVESRMGEKGLIFSDGMQDDFLSFNYSVTSTFGIAPEKGHLLVKD